MDADKVEKLVAQLKDTQGAFERGQADFKEKDDARNTAYAALQVLESERDQTRDALARALQLK